MPFETIIFEKTGHVATITLNRPKVLNAYNLQMRDELYQALEAVRDDTEIYSAIFKGAGERAFCAGADLTEFLSAPPPVKAREVRRQRDVWGLFLSINKPLIAAVHGFVVGVGVEIALACDIRIACEDATFTMPEVGLGIIPSAGGTQMLARIIGRGRALDMLLTGTTLSARQAYQAGLINDVVPGEELMDRVKALAQKLAGYSPRAVAAAKEAVTRGLDLTLEQGLRLEAELSRSLFYDSNE